MTEPKTSKASGDKDGLLAAALIHEMRHPLMGAKAGLQLLALQLDPETQKLEDWHILSTQIARLEELFTAYAEILQPDRQQAIPLDVEGVLRRAIDLLHHRLRTLGGRFAFDLEPGLPLVIGTASALLHSTINLLQNAIDALPPKDPKGQIALAANRHGDVVEIRVSDSGAGVSDDIASRLFNPRVTSKPPGKGTGLGLYISSTMLRATGGELTLGARGDPKRRPWATTEFLVRLPVAPSSDR